MTIKGVTAEHKCLYLRHTVTHHILTSQCGRTGYTGPTGRTGPRHDPPDPSAYSTHTALPRLAS